MATNPPTTSEFRRLLSIALPSVLLQIFLLLIWTESAIACSRMLGTAALAAFSLGNLSGNVTGFAVIIRILSASDTLSPRAVGAQRYAEVGNLAVRGTFYCHLVLFPLVFLWWKIEGPLISLGQPEDTAHKAAGWLRWYLFSLPPLVLFNVMQRVLNAQEIVMPLVYISALTSLVVHPLLLYFLVGQFGLNGSAMAFILTNWIQFGTAMLFVKVRGAVHPKTFERSVHLAWVTDCSSPSRRAIFNKRDMVEFLLLGVGGLMSMSEWIFWEIVCFTVGRFGVTPLATHTVAYNLIPLCFMVPLGIAIGVGVRIGHLMSLGDGRKARRMVLSTLFTSMTISAIYSGLIYYLRGPIVRLFTDDKEVMDGCEEIWGMVSIFIFLDGLFAIQQGVMKALGMQLVMAGCVFLCCWVSGLGVIFWKVSNGGDLGMIWSTLPIVYIFLNSVSLCACHGVGQAS